MDAIVAVPSGRPTRPRRAGLSALGRHVGLVPDRSRDAPHVTLPDTKRRPPRGASVEHPRDALLPRAGRHRAPRRRRRGRRRAVVLAAPGTFGKTTLAAAFHAAGHRLLSEDTTCVRGVRSAARRARTGDAAPSPRRGSSSSRSRMRRRSGRSATIGSTSRSIPRCAATAARSRSAPSCCSARADEGFRIEPVPPDRAVRDLWSLSFRLPTDADRARCFTAVADLARSVPVWNLHRPLTMRDLPATVDFVVQPCLGRRTNGSGSAPRCAWPCASGASTCGCGSASGARRCPPSSGSSVARRSPQSAPAGPAEPRSAPQPAARAAASALPHELAGPLPAAARAGRPGRGGHRAPSGGARRTPHTRGWSSTTATSDRRPAAGATRRLRAFREARESGHTVCSTLAAGDCAQLCTFRHSRVLPAFPIGALHGDLDSSARAAASGKAAWPRSRPAAAPGARSASPAGVRRTLHQAPAAVGASPRSRKERPPA